MKKNIIKVIIILLLLVYPLCRAVQFSSLKSKGAPNTPKIDETADLEAISELNGENAADIEKRIEDLNVKKQNKLKAEKLRQERKNNINLLRDQISNGKASYRQILSLTVIAGDSLMHSLYEYNVLDKSLLVTKVSASLYHLKDNIDKIVSLNPKILVLHYGLNSMSTNDKEIDNFIKLYTSLIKQLKAKLPNTKIVISSVFEVRSDKAKGRFSNISHFNDRLSKMCKDNGCVFLNNKELLKDDKSYYESDGMHLKKKFYTETYLPNLIIELGL